MKTLLICNTWYPWHNSGTFRWLHLSKFIDFAVLTTKKPRQGFYDDTMPKGNCKKLYRCGSMLPAFLAGLYLSFRSLFIRADKYIYTCPPESLLLGAWLNQLLGRNVYVDMRDKIDRHTQCHKWAIPFYRWLYKRIKNVCVCMQFLDPEKTVIRHGYDDIDKDETLFTTVLDGKLCYRSYCGFISCGYYRDYSDIKFKNYNSSSLVTLRHLGNPIKGKENLHPECFEFEPQPWSEIAEQMNEFLSR